MSRCSLRNRFSNANNTCPSSNLTSKINNNKISHDIHNSTKKYEIDNESLFDQIVWTPYYRTIPDVTITGCVEEPDFNYTSYDIFVLNTRLIYWLSHNFVPGLMVKYPSQLKDGKFYLTIELVIGNKPYKMTSDQIKNLQYFVSDITSNTMRAALLISSDSFTTSDANYNMASSLTSTTNYLTHSIDSINDINSYQPSPNFNPGLELGLGLGLDRRIDRSKTSALTLIPSVWIKSILPYIGIPENVNPHMSSEGIMVELRDFIDYEAAYYDLLIKSMDRIRQMYADGYIVNPPKEIAINWNLLATDIEGNLFRPTDEEDFIGALKPEWNDSRITIKYGGMYGFLMSRIEGIDYIDFYVGYKLIAKHNLAKYMIDNNIAGIFSDQYVRIPVDNITEAQAIASQIDLKTKAETSVVLHLPVTRLSWILLYTEIARKMGYDDCIGYGTDNELLPYTFSCIVPSETDLIEVSRTLNRVANEIIFKIELDNIATNKLFSMELSITRQKFPTVHDLIESRGLPT